MPDLMDYYNKGLTEVKPISVHLHDEDGSLHTEVTGDLVFTCTGII